MVASNLMKRTTLARLIAAPGIPLFWASALLLPYSPRVNAEPLRIIKTVPEGATIEYRVNGSVLQAMALRPGVYEIIVRELEDGGGVHSPPRHKH